MTITADTTAVELAALVSQTLEAAGIKATLSGGGAVSVYTHNPYQSSDLDFVTAVRRDHWRDRQSWDQAVLVAAHQSIDYDELTAHAAAEGADPGDIAKLRQQASRRA